MINVDLGDGVIREMEESLLEGPFYSDGPSGHAVEYHLNGKVVHRSVVTSIGLPTDSTRPYELTITRDGKGNLVGGRVILRSKI